MLLFPANGDCSPEILEAYSSLLRLILSRQHVIRLAELLFAQFDGDGLSIAV